jgi:hypothetical protein
VPDDGPAHTGPSTLRGPPDEGHAERTASTTDTVNPANEAKTWWSIDYRSTVIKTNNLVAGH